MIWLKQKILIILAILLAPMVLTPAFAIALDCSNPTTAQAQIQCGANDVAGKGSSNSSSSLGDTVTSIVNILSIVAGVAAVIMIIIGGLRYVTSGGKQESVTSAKNTILYAIVGLIVVALAQIIVHFVLKNVK